MTDDRTLYTSRTLPFSSKEIFLAFESPDLLTQWWGPNGFSNTFEKFEFSEGGQWKFVMHGPDGADYQNESIFEEIVPERKIVIHHNCPPNFRLIIELTPKSEGTLLTWRQVFDDAKTAAAVKLRAGPANEESIDKLTRVLCEIKNDAQ